MKILVADDEPVARTLFAHWLTSWGYQVISVTDGLSALRALESDPEIRLAVLDWMMPERSGPDVVRALRQRAGDQYVYVILVTGRQDTADVVEGLDSGADDYIVKPCNPLELKVRLRAGRRVVDLQQELLRAQEVLRYEAMRDGLTGLLNRRATLRALDQELARSERTRDPVSILMFDLDHFKAINDQHGHAAGDQVLVTAAECLLRGVRGYDHVGRLGGEEFLIVLPGCNATNALVVAERIRSSMDSIEIASSNARLRFSTSIGVAGAGEHVSTNSQALLARADCALYAAKRLGRNRTELATPDGIELIELRQASSG
jgi:diguanylate cyclase (GGDEF)-like protein